jgi:hypothetical protein
MDVSKEGRNKGGAAGERGFIRKYTVLIIINCHGKYCNRHVR